ncbi:hypothetical protein [Herbiconiux daphne]|uniref:Capsular polysaccharide biosynthesis protein n=1 Tax=Herbiconiux daphne TaxID=2970914 RepID=A0ABT2H6M3_9MICO|nr:hypothetical protein [Herbiconiux daphne]MCS5735600.1 hypothetical protein [Herbiconiux daphne]
MLRQKILLIIGIVVAIAAGLLAGFTITDGHIESRVVRTYQASSTVLLSAPTPTYYQVEIPGSVTEVPQADPAADPNAAAAPDLIQNPATPIDLASSAIILAYIASSDEVSDGVSAAIGGLEDGDAITAVRRTTQPAGDEAFGGRLQLPIVNIVGVSTSAERAEEIANQATKVFGDLVSAQQAEWGVPEDIRLTLDELNAPKADAGTGSNPAIPVIIVALGVFLLFVAIALVIEAIRERRRKSGADAGEPDDDLSPDDDAAVVPVAATSRAGRSKSSDTPLATTPAATTPVVAAPVVAAPVATATPDVAPPVSAAAKPSRSSKASRSAEPEGTAVFDELDDSLSEGPDENPDAGPSTSTPSGRLTRRQVRALGPTTDDSAPGTTDSTRG